MLTVSIVTHDTPELLLRGVMRSLEQESVDKIFIIDNSPSTPLYLQSLPDAYNSDIICFHIPNRGFGNAHNFAIQQAIQAGSDYHLVLNPDVRWPKPVLRTLINVLVSRPDCALIQPLVTYPDGSIQHTCRLLPTPIDVFARRFLPKVLFKKRLNRFLLPESAYLSEFNAVYMQGSFMLFKTAALMKTGLFDERFFMYPEDIDITRRIREKYDAIHFPAVSVIHDHAAASSHFNRMLWIHIVNMVRYFNKWGWFFDSERRRLNRRLLHDLNLK